MKTLKEYKNEVISEDVQEIFCNVCGTEIKKNSFGYYDQHLSVEKQWGYGSPFDSETHSFDICHDCYESLIKTFKIKI